MFRKHSADQEIRTENSHEMITHSSYQCHEMAEQPRQESRENTSQEIQNFLVQFSAQVKNEQIKEENKIQAQNSKISFMIYYY